MAGAPVTALPTRRPGRPRMTLAGLAALASLANLATFAGPASADTTPGPNVVTPYGTRLPCQPEQFPHAGSPRSAGSVPYEIPFTATLGPDPSPVVVAGGATAYPSAPAGGWLMIRGTSQLIPGATVTVTLGGPVVNDQGQLYAQACGLVQLPNETGGIGAGAYQQPGNVNPNFEFTREIPVSLGISVPGISLPSSIIAYGDADGFLGSAIARQPAANGGLNVSFDSTAKSTSDLSALLTVPAISVLAGPASGGSDCTIAIGDLRQAGVSVPPGGIGGLDYQQATTPVHLDTQTSFADPTLAAHTLSGQPVTGPIQPSASGHAQTHATLVSDTFPVAAIQTQMPPSPEFPNYQGCSQSNASTLNKLLGLPNPAGHNFFYAPGTFAVFTSS